MRTLMLVSALAIGVVFSTPHVANAQESCKGTETANDCTIRVRSELRAKVKEEGSSKAAEVAKKTETGLADLSNGLSSSLKDFLPLMQLSGLLGPSTADSKTGVVSVALNKPTGPGDVQFRALIGTKPSAFNPLREKITTEQAASLDKAIAAGKNQTDITGEVSFNFVGDRIGRDYRRYQALLNKLFLAETSEASEKVVIDSRLLRNALNSVLLSEPRVDFNETKLGALTAERRAAISDAIIALQTELYRLTTDWHKAAGKSGVSLFGQLISNQPQLHATAAYTRRDAWLGPDRVFTAKVTWEAIGIGKNLNAFIDYAMKLGCDPRAAKDGCAERYRDFVSVNRKSIEGGTRVAFSGSLEKRLRDYNPELPDGTRPYGLRSGSNLAVAADIGGVIGADEDGKAEGRWDLAVQLERRDPMVFPIDATEGRIRRAVVSATLTKKIGDVSIPLGLVWANRSEYLPKDTRSDHPISAHIGLKFSLFPLK